MSVACVDSELIIWGLGYCNAFTSLTLSLNPLFLLLMFCKLMISDVLSFTR